MQNLAHTFRLKRNAPSEKVEAADAQSDNLGNYYFSNVATLKYAWDIYNLKTKIGNKQVNYEVSVKPAELNTVDQTLAVKHASSYEPVTGVFETTNGFKYGSPNLGGSLKLWSTVSYYDYFIFNYFPYWLIYLLRILNQNYPGHNVN